ncbi:MAG: hypothetical protein COA78_28040 [Blastopirellula sp.]|nr:MAG: hypothetical protein COA78_28040 [Blastopirellula sp.]
MKVQQFLEHHGITTNPFAVEDAQTDMVFKENCIESAYHPAWHKVYGNPEEPATSIVFGEKGAGKTAMRLQIVKHLANHNQQHPDSRTYIIEYDDFNPFLDRFQERFRGRKKRPERMLKQWKLWDHMDAILTIGVTQMADRILETKHSHAASGCDISSDQLSQLDKHQARDLLLLMACYDQSTAETYKTRWQQLRKKLGFWNLASCWQFAVGSGVSAAIVALVLVLASTGNQKLLHPIAPYFILLFLSWLPWIWKSLSTAWKAWRIVKRVRVGNREKFSLCKLLMNFTGPQLASQPLPTHDRSDDRYELLDKFQGILETLGFTGMVVIVDRVDEPHLINGSPELMKLLLWPMLDNKFLKQQGIGLKLLLPIEIQPFIERETKEFYQRARLDKQNVIPSLEWTSEALFDVANARLAACSEGEPKFRDLFDSSISDQRLFDALRSLRVPRSLFKFLYRLLVAHCNTYTENEPVWQISSPTFESTLAVCLKDQEAFDRGLGAG